MVKVVRFRNEIGMEATVDGDYVRFVDLSREKLGEMIYRSMYEHKGGMWSANETKDVWYNFADNFMKILFKAPTDAR